ncbi:hypothetical protein [Cellvibrio sp. QJXJ]|uniref:hypothetical protein n=1 Tax=Cellvibrio sp. QJXJ TaxID=2964606 RepID=UPI0021C49C7A|nr:hypothetical protein [Cellvibrio sp. QJXJ]UUA75203.1 hypothetical protein NNX04_22355 [Cellvibrio sp. QJXJ]
MIDPNDKQTLSLLPTPPKKRGKKPTGKGKTPAQRKADQRARDGWKMVNASASKSYAEVTLTGLLEQLAFAVSAKNPDLVKALSKELVRRATPVIVIPQ